MFRTSVNKLFMAKSGSIRLLSSIGSSVANDVVRYPGCYVKIESFDENVLNSFHEFSSRLSNEMKIESIVYNDFTPRVSLKNINRAVFAYGASKAQYANVINYRAIESVDEKNSTNTSTDEEIQLDAPVVESELLIDEQAEEDDLSQGQEGAIRADGSINWDCPCLNGMAHGPCGEEFKTAFSCFIGSLSEPKGVECVDAFRAMQSCMVQYPEEYGLQDEPEVIDDGLVEKMDDITLDEPILTNNPDIVV